MNIFSIDGGLYRFLERFTNFFFLNLLWAIMCIPVVTIFPATAAMFGVVRQWVQEKDAGVFKSFFKLFKENFLQSFVFGIIWLVIAFILYFNFSVSLHMPQTAKVIIITAMMLISMLFLMTTIFLFPVMVHYNMKWFLLIKNSFLFSVSQLWITIVCGIILLLAVLFSYIIPLTSLIVWSITAYLVYRLCNRSFVKIESMMNNN